MKLIVNFILLLFSCQQVFAQISIDSFYRVGAEWIEYEERIGYSDQYNDLLVVYTGYKFRIDRDTMMNSKTYHIVLQDGFASYATVQGIVVSYGNFTSPFTSKAYLRTEGRKVFYTSVSGPLYSLHEDANYPYNTEVLLYDFGMQIGDTLPFWPTQTLQSIDSVQLTNGAFVKRYHFQGNVWIEGIGAVSGLIGSYAPIPIPPQAQMVVSNSGLCYNNMDIAYHFPVNVGPAINERVWNNCFDVSYLNIEAISATANDISLYPNPVGRDYLMINGNVNKIDYCEVYDLTGKMRYNARISNDMRLNIPGPVGFYFLKIYFKDKTVLTKTFSRI